MNHEDLLFNINLIKNRLSPENLEKIPLRDTSLGLNSPAFWIKPSLPDIEKNQFIIYQRNTDLIISDLKAKKQ